MGIETMRVIEIDFYPDNMRLLCAGLKTTTLRSEKQADKIGMLKGEEGKFYIDDNEFIITYLGQVTVLDLGGYDAVWKSEGFKYTGGPKFKQTEYFLNGTMVLHAYRIKKI
jgi:hypothetical protein